MTESGAELLPVEEGFVQVRRGRRPTTVVVKAGGLGDPMRDSRKGKDLPNLVLTNSFGNLEKDMESGEIREASDINGDIHVINVRGTDDTIMPKIASGDKENMDPAYGVKHGKVGVNNTGLVFGSEIGKSPSIAQLGLKSKKNGHGKSAELGRPKQNVASRPTRGLVFGPTKGEIELSANGKCLRVEQNQVGRPGGFVITEKMSVKGNKVLGKNSTADSIDDHMDQEKYDEVSMHATSGSSPERPIDKQGA